MLAASDDVAAVYAAAVAAAKERPDWGFDEIAAVVGAFCLIAVGLSLKV